MTLRNFNVDQLKRPKVTLVQLVRRWAVSCRTRDHTQGFCIYTYTTQSIPAAGDAHDARDMYRLTNIAGDLIKVKTYERSLISGPVVRIPSANSIRERTSCKRSNESFLYDITFQFVDGLLSRQHDGIIHD